MNGSFLKKIVLVNTRNTSLYTFHICISIASHFSCVRRKKENFDFLPKMIVWSHLPNNESSTPRSLTKLKLVMKIRSIQEEDVLILRVDWLINWLYAAVDVEDSILCPSGESLSNAYHLEDLALNSPINIEQPRFKSSIF